MSSFCLEPNPETLRRIGEGEDNFTEDQTNALIRAVIGHPFFDRLKHVMQMMPRIPLEVVPAGVYNHHVEDIAISLERLMKAKTSKNQDRFFDEVAEKIKRPAEVNNRWSHSLEVMAVGKAIAKGLGVKGFSRDVIALTCLLHDIGHCPFGHEGEHAIKEALRNRNLSPDLIDHNRNGLVKAAAIGVPQAVACGLVYHDGLPLDSEAVRSKYNIQTLPEPYRNLAFIPSAWPALEFQIASIADDISNAARDLVAILKISKKQNGAGVSFAELCEQSELFKDKAKDWLKEKFPKKKNKIDIAFNAAQFDQNLEELQKDIKNLFSDKKEPPIHRLTCRVVKHVRDAFVADAVATALEKMTLSEPDQPLISLSPNMLEQMNILKALSKRERDKLTERDGIAEYVTFLFDQAMDNPSNTGFTQELREKLQAKQDLGERAQVFIAHFIEMTDEKAFNLYKSLKKGVGEEVMQDQEHFVAKLLKTLGVSNAR